MTDIVRVAGAQIDIGLADKAGNLHKTLNCCRKAAEKGARVVIFPELTLTGYNVDDHAEIPPLAESVPGPATTESANEPAEEDRKGDGVAEHHA